MPFKSEGQRRFLWMKRPDIARKWTKEHGSTPQPDQKKEAIKRRKEKNG